MQLQGCCILLHTTQYLVKKCINIRWCSIGVNIDIEIDGKNNHFERPVVVIKKINLQSALVAPLTSSPKDNPYVYPLKTIISYVSLSQIRTISNKRLLRRVVKITTDEYAHIIIRLKYILGSIDETPA